MIKAHDLNLTIKQAAKINALREAHLEEIKPLLEEMIETNRTLRDLWLAPQPDKKRIEALQVEAQKLSLRLTHRIEAYQQEVYRELTSDQRKRVQIRDIDHNKGCIGVFGMDGKSTEGLPKVKNRMQDRGMGIKIP